MFVLDANGKVVYAETVKEVASEPNYDAALQALKSCCKFSVRRARFAPLPAVAPLLEKARANCRMSL